jgi:hypothetical protein
MPHLRFHHDREPPPRRLCFTVAITIRWVLAGRMSNPLIVHAEHAEVHLPACDLSLDVIPEAGGFEYRLTDLRKKIPVQIQGGCYVSVENAKHKAEEDARQYVGGYAGPIHWAPIRFHQA